MDCNECIGHKVDPVPYIVHESAMARNERTNKRLVGIIVLLIVLLCASIGFIVYRETEFQREEIEVVQDNESGHNSFIGNDGDIVYGGYSDGEANYTD